VSAPRPPPPARTTFDTLAPAPTAERVRAYRDDLAVHDTLLTIGGRYGGRAHAGDYRALVVWTRRGGRWQQVAGRDALRLSRTLRRPPLGAGDGRSDRRGFA
jgi:hypothetical protein